MYCSDWNFHKLPPSLYSPNERRNKFHLNDEWYQLDATNLFIIINNSTCFWHLYARLKEYRLYTLYTTAYTH